LNPNYGDLQIGRSFAHYCPREGTVSDRQASDIDNLCYLPACDVQVQAGRLEEFHLCSLDDRTLGTVDGVLIDPAERRLRYFVVQAGTWLGRKRYLLSADETTTHLEPEEGVLRVDVEAHDPWRHVFDASSLRPFSDDDVVTAVFATHPGIH